MIGNVGQNPEITTLEGGRKKAKFTIATTETYRNAKGEKVTDTQWHNLVAWGRIAEIIEKHVTKGSEVAVEGKITYRTFTDKEGMKKSFAEIQVSELLMLGNKRAE